MELSVKMQEGLDEVAKALQTCHELVITKQREAAELVNKNDFSALIKKFNWEAEISEVVYGITVEDGAYNVEIVRASTLVAQKIFKLIEDIDYGSRELVWQDFPELKIAYDDSKNLDLQDAITEYLEAKGALYERETDTSIGTKHNGWMEIRYSAPQSPEDDIRAEFDINELQQWIATHMVVQNEHCVFVE